MTSDPVTPFLTNAYQQEAVEGPRGGRVPRAEEERGRGAAHRLGPGRTRGQQGVPGRRVRAVRQGRAHVKPGDSDYDHGASATLEYALSDAMLGQMAKELGHADDAKRYTERAQNYRKIFDARPGSSGRGTRPAPSPGPPTPPRARASTRARPGSTSGSCRRTLPGMVGLIGAQDAANQRLDSFFAYDQLVEDPAKTAREVWVNGPYAYYNADKYNPQNEPDLIAPYTYLSTGQPWKTTDVVHAALTLFTDAPTGMTGNDDLGTMSAWNVLSSIGIFPVQPGTDTWGLSTPVFERVDVTLDRRYYPQGS